LLFLCYIAVLSQMKKEVHGTTTKMMGSNHANLAMNPDGLMRMDET